MHVCIHSYMYTYIYIYILMYRVAHLSRVSCYLHLFRGGIKVKERPEWLLQIVTHNVHLLTWGTPLLGFRENVARLLL